MAITYSVDDCETKIAELETKLDELATLPTSGRIGADTVNLDKTYDRTKERLKVWERRLQQALNGGKAVRDRRVV